MVVERVLLVEPRSFCAGVETAIKTLAWMVVLHDEPVFCVHAIVHNEGIVRRFERLGTVFVDDVADVPPGSPLVLSAHGSAPSVIAAAASRASVAVDAVCPLVTKVHREIRTRAAAGDTVVYVGHPGHDEAAAAVAIAPHATHIVSSADDVASLPRATARVALLAQTTIALDRLEEVERAVRRRFDDVWTPRRSDLCYATTNRQRALRGACDHVDAVVVVGSATSSNTAALVALARAHAPRAVRVDGAGEVPPDHTGTVAVTAGASAPENDVAEVVAALRPRNGVEHFAPIDEAEYFPLPPALRLLLARADADGRLPADLRDAFAHDRTMPALALLELVESAFVGRRA